jgi:GDP-mannose 4,6-dehydratase
VKKIILGYDMNIMITGITGMVGSHMCDYLLKNVPDVNIYATRRWRSDDRNISHLYGNDRVKFFESDLLDRGSLSNIIKQSKPDFVFHFAAQSYPMASFSTPVATLTTNVIGTTNLLDELRVARDNFGIDPVIVNCSSSEIYGNPSPEEVPIKETNPIRAANPYSISKVGQDLMGQFYYNAYGLKVMTTRLFSHEGSRRGRNFALSSFAYQVVQQEKLYIQHRDEINHGQEYIYTIRVGNLNSIRTYAHVDDAVEAYWIVANHGILGDVYNIGGSHTCTVGEALENMLQKSEIPRGLIFKEIDPARIRPTDITLQIPDCTKFKELTGWEPKKTLDDINQDLLEYWRGML